MTAPPIAHTVLRHHEDPTVLRLLAQAEAWHQDQVFPTHPDAQRALIVLPRTERSVLTARILVTSMFWEETALDTSKVSSVVSELVTGAVRSGPPAPGVPDTITVAAILGPSSCRVEVGEFDPRIPSPRKPTGLSGPRLGLVLGDGLCDERGTRQFTGGKVTWAQWDRL